MWSHEEADANKKETDMEQHNQFSFQLVKPSVCDTHQHRKPTPPWLRLGTNIGNVWLGFRKWLVHYIICSTHLKMTQTALHSRYIRTLWQNVISEELDMRTGSATSCRSYALQVWKRKWSGDVFWQELYCSVGIGAEIHILSTVASVIASISFRGWNVYLQHRQLRSLIG